MPSCLFLQLPSFRSSCFIIYLSFDIRSPFVFHHLPYFTPTRDLKSPFRWHQHLSFFRIASPPVPLSQLVISTSSCGSWPRDYLTRGFSRKREGLTTRLKSSGLKFRKIELPNGTVFQTTWKQIRSIHTRGSQSMKLIIDNIRQKSIEII